MDIFGSYLRAVRILESLLVTASRDEAIEIRKCISAIMSAQENELRAYEAANEPQCDVCHSATATQYCKETAVGYCDMCFAQAEAQADAMMDQMAIMEESNEEQ